MVHGWFPAGKLLHIWQWTGFRLERRSRAANLSLSKKVLLSLKNHDFEVKKVFLSAERASRARSAKFLSAGVQGPLKGPGKAHRF